MDKIKISFVGDISITGKAEEYILDKNNKYGEEFLSMFNDSDLIVVNLESPITKSEIKTKKKPYIFKSSPEVLDIFDDRFVFCLANNHITDYDIEGLNDTKKELNSRGFSFCGAGNDFIEASQITFIKIKGKTFSLINAGDERYEIAKENCFGICPAKESLLLEKVRIAKFQSDFIIVSLHMGIEFLKLPSDYQIRISNKLLKEGANIILHHHSHCLSGYTLNNNNNVIFWGLGNFLFPYSAPVGFKKWYNTAIFNTFLDMRNLNIIDIEIKPKLINSIGIPEQIVNENHDNILTDILKSSRIINSGKLKIHRIVEIFTINYFIINIRNYLKLLKLIGLKKTIKSLINGIKAQLFRQT
jgi:poly-gamma-glutamate capsule biosynthesis protein CapA/YwtB (metallophosphatase superfamily)